MMELIIEEEIEALKDMDTVDTNVSSVEYFYYSEDYNNIDNGQSNMLCSQKECDKQLDMVKISMAYKNITTEDFLQLTKF